MKNLRRLNSKEKKNLVKALQENFGFTGEIAQDVLFNENRKKYYLINPEVLESIEGLRVETIGMYFGQLMPEGVVRLTIEGSQYIGQECDKQILDVTDEQFFEWIRGRDLELETDKEGWLLIKHGNDFCGCGKVVHKQEAGEDVTLIHNYIPKSRYVRSED